MKKFLFFVVLALTACCPAAEKFMLPGEVVLEMVKIPAGTFTMGFGSSKRKVTLEYEFYIGKYEITQAQFTAVMRRNPSRFRTADRPVDSVTWNEATLFCDELNRLLADKLPAGYKFALPSEEQWEYACRAGTDTTLNNGENMIVRGVNNSPNLDKLAWYRGNCAWQYELPAGHDVSVTAEFQYPGKLGGTHPVGLKLPNSWGLYDMHGNVWEWCSNWYIQEESQAAYSRKDLRRTQRGGGWYNPEVRFCRAESRSGHTADARRQDIGFRAALIRENETLK